MKFKINRDHFSNCLQKVQSIVSTKSSMPVLSNVLIQATEGQITISTTNLDLALECQVKAEVSEQGSLTLPVRKLFTIVKSLPNIDVELDADKTQAKIVSGSSRFRVLGIDESEFPPIPQLQNAQTFTLSQEAVSRMVKSVAYAQSTDESRFILNGIYFNFSENGLSLVATDGRRLGLIKTDLEDTVKEETSFILPAPAAHELERLLGVGETLTIAFNDRQVAFTITVSGEKESAALVNSIYFVSKVVEGKYPNYRQVIPKETKHRVKLDREHLLDCLHRAALVTTDRNNSVKLTINENLLEITGSSPDLGDSHESIAIDYPHESVELAFNPQYLIDPLKSVTRDEVFFEFKDDLSPGLFKTMDSFLCVVMPLRLN